MKKIYLLFILAILSKNLFYGNEVRNEFISLTGKAISLMNKGELSDVKSVLDSADILLINNELDYHQLYRANLYYCYGLYYKNTSQFFKALELYNLAYDIYKSFQNYESVSLIEANIGRIYQRIGDLHLAESYFNQSITSLTKKEIPPKYKLSLTYFYLGNIYYEMRDFNRALTSLNKSKQLVSEINELKNIPVLTKLALTYNNIGNKDSCLYYHNLAINIYDQQSSDNYNKRYLDDLLQFVNSLLKYELYHKANVILKEAAEILEMNNALHKSFSLIYYIQRARIEFILNNYSESINILKPVVLSSINSSNSFYHINNHNSILALKILSQSYHQLFQNSDLYAHLDSAAYFNNLAILELDKLKANYLSEESKFFIAENENELYTNSVDIVHALHQHENITQRIEQAFDISERSKYSVLLSAIRGNNALELSGIPDSLVLQEKQLKQHLTLYKKELLETKMRNNPDSGKIKSLEEKQFAIQEEYITLTKYLKKNFSNYHQLKHNTSVASIHEVQKHLGKNAALIEYIYGDSCLYAIYIDKSDKAFIKLPFYEDDNKLIFQLYNSLKSFNFMQQTANEQQLFNELSYTLYNKLIKPVEKYINKENIIIVPTGALSFVPFEILINKESSNTYTNYSSLNYLIRNYSFSYAYSSTILLESLTNKRKKVATKFLGVAPTYNFTNTTDKTLLGLKNLPGAQKEVKFLQNLTGGTALFGENANVDTFKNIAQNYDVLHLAMHTLINDDSPMLSKLVFSANNNDSLPGTLTTGEIFNLNLNAKLSVLSACSSGEGELKNGEGVMSLARGFMYAGCPSLVLTLWPVEDNSGNALMRSFYSNLLKGKSKNEALRNAKLEYLKNVPPQATHPFFWSGYICLGNAEPIQTSKRSALIAGVICAFIIAGIATIILKRKRA